MVKKEEEREVKKKEKEVEVNGGVDNCESDESVRRFQWSIWWIVIWINDLEIIWYETQTWLTLG